MIDQHSAIRVVIADGQASFRRVLRALLEPEHDMLIVGEACDASDTHALTCELKPDVLLVEGALLHGIDSQSGALPTVRTVVTTPAHERTDIIRAFLQGASAIVPKPSAAHVWPESIRTVVAGRYWLGHESIAVLVQALREHVFQWTEPKAKKAYRLTKREVEIIGKIASGHSNKEVGMAFSIRERTVKHHLTNIFSKVGVSSRLELALFAVNHRVPELPVQLIRDAKSRDELEHFKSGGGPG
jgi:DNA-binding NarL/FixJ family response regulator